MIGLSCEYIRDQNGAPILLSFLRTDVISDKNGNGSGSCFSAVFSKQSEASCVEDEDAYKTFDRESLNSSFVNKAGCTRVNKSLSALAQVTQLRTNLGTEQQQQKVQDGSTTWRTPRRDTKLSARSRALSAAQANHNSTTNGAPDLRTQHRSLRRPYFVSRLGEEVEILKNDLISKDQLLNSSQYKIQALEQEKEIAALSFKECFSSKQNELETLRSEVSELRNDNEGLLKKLNLFEEENTKLKEDLNRTQNLLSEERETALHTIREYQNRDEQQKNQVQQLQDELEAISMSLKEELATSLAFKRHLVNLHDRKRPAEILCDDLENVLELTHSLWSDQMNPKGERYAIARVLQTHEADTRSAFLHYCQLEDSCTKYWPPRMSFISWTNFCKDAEISDPRAGARISSNKHSLMLPVVEIQKLFHDYAVSEGDSGSKLLTFEGFLASLVSCSQKLSTLSFLSECLRDFIMRYVLKAQNLNMTCNSSKKKTTKKEKQTRSLSKKPLRT
eukprot:g1759.t1